MEAMTCAHRNHPKGTLLKVTRMDNGQSVVVRVNDRGPYSQGAVVDISRAAASKINLLRDGRARVTVEPVGYSETNPGEKAVTQQQQPSSYSQVQSRQSGSVYYPAPQKRYPSQNQMTTKSGYYTPPSNDTQTPSSYNNTTGRRLNEQTTKSGSTKPTINRLAPGVKGYAIQLSSFKNIDNANRQVLAIQEKGINDVYLMQKGGLNRVVIAAFPNKFAAQQYLDRLRQQYYMDGIIIMLR
jgi:rare lipoprotein A